VEQEQGINVVRLAEQVILLEVQVQVSLQLQTVALASRVERLEVLMAVQEEVGTRLVVLALLQELIALT
jgi:hypothetical protein